MIRHRPLLSYEDYVARQGFKAQHRRTDLIAGKAASRRGFLRAFQAVQRYLRDGPVLCLGARTGAEVEAAIAVGFTGSKGIDLHPLSGDVIQGDWHALPFPDGSFANAFTNSLDHCQSLDLLCAEVVRVLEPEGIFFVMATDREPRTPFERWLEIAPGEFLFWDHSQHLRDAIAERGFVATVSWQMGKWGCHVLRKG